MEYIYFFSENWPWDWFWKNTENTEKSYAKHIFTNDFMKIPITPLPKLLQPLPQPLPKLHPPSPSHFQDCTVGD